VLLQSKKKGKNKNRVSKLLVVRRVTDWLHVGSSEAFSAARWAVCWPKRQEGNGTWCHPVMTPSADQQ